MSEKSILIRGGYGSTNFGDDALMKVIYDEFLESKTNVTFSCVDADYLDKIAPKSSIIGVKECYDEYSYLIYGGGTQFYSFKPKRNFFGKIIYTLNNFDIVLKKIKGKFIKKNKCDYKNTKLGALGVGVGPFLPEANPAIEQNTSNLFKKMDFLAIRDLYSHNKCNEWGVNHHYFTDICYASRNPNFNKTNINESVKKIGVVVRDWIETNEGGTYDKSLIESVSKLRKQGYEITFIVFAKDKDLKWLSKLNSLGERIILWNPSHDTIDSFIDKLSSFDMFITARYHGAVYSSLLGKPFITIEVEQKLSLIHDVFEKGSYVWSYPFEKNNLIDKTLEIDANYIQFVQELNNKTKLNQEQAEIMKSRFKEFINL